MTTPVIVHTRRSTFHPSTYHLITLQSGLQQPSRELGASVVGQGILLLGGADHPLPALARSVAVEDLAQLAPPWKVDDTRER